MPVPVENISAQGQLQDLQYGYNADDRPPLHEHLDHAINNYAGVASDIPAQAHAAPPAPVSTDLTFPHTLI